MDTVTLMVGDEFTNVHMREYVCTICWIFRDENRLVVGLKGETEFIETDWNLQHTIWAFERGEYQLIKK